MNVAVLGLAVYGFLMFAIPTASGLGEVQGSAGDPLQPLAFLIGRWEGTSEGQPGTAKVQREYTRILNSRWMARTRNLPRPRSR